MRIGELLIMSGVITQENLDKALQVHVHSKKKLGEMLIDDGAITDRQLAEVLEFQLGFPIINLFDTPLDPKAVRMVPEAVARRYCVTPVDFSGGKLRLAMADPLNYDAIEEVGMAAGMSIQPLIAVRAELELAINRNYAMQNTVEEVMGDLKKTEIKPDEEKADDPNSPVIKLVNQIIQSAVQQRASDIHIEPQENNVQVKYRIDGALRQEKDLPKHMEGVVTARLKIISGLNIAEKRLPQDGRIQMQSDGRKIDIRVSSLPTVNGESIVMRILDQSAGVKRISDLGLSEPNRIAFEKLIKRPNGIILITGPTGSGKTSTLYSAISQINAGDVKIITIEDPVEYRMAGVSQVQVNTQIGLSFASGLRSILRQDPNIVMVGEIRDSETAEIAVRASLTGHLVFSTIHTNSSVSTISRLVDMGIDPYLIASSVSCVVAQRLVRKICKDCGERVPARAEEIKLFEAFGLQEQLRRKGTETAAPASARAYSFLSAEEKPVLTRGKGCAACSNTGYRGRIAVHEVLVVDEALRRLVVSNRPVTELNAHLQDCGFKTMMHDGLLKVAEGLTTTEEVLKAVSDE